MSYCDVSVRARPEGAGELRSWGDRRIFRSSPDVDGVSNFADATILTLIATRNNQHALLGIFSAVRVRANGDAAGHRRLS